MNKFTPIQIIAKIKNKWYKMTLQPKDYVKCKEIEDPSNKTQLLTLKSFLSERGFENYLQNIESIIKTKKIYIPRPPIGEALTEKEWENFWFSKINHLCEKCKNKCKQSCYVEIVTCPSYVKK